MKYKSEKTLRRAKKAFSLIELMIVIVIIGALTAIILPQFDVSEAEAKDTGCDASNYGTLSQLSKFRSINGAFPTRMHTGFEASEGAAATTLMGGITVGDEGGAKAEENTTAAIPSFTAYNMAQSTTTTNVGSGSVYADSLTATGIVNLAYGGFPTDAKTSADVAFLSLLVDDVKVNVCAIDANWFEAWAVNETTGLPDESQGLNESSTPISINGVPLPFYMYEDPYSEYSADSTNIPSIGDDGTDGIVVPLFIAPTTDWEHWYDEDGNQNDSKIQIAQVGQCPWLEGVAEFRYYIAIFKVYANGSKAKLLGTMCPEGGSLNP